MNRLLGIGAVAAVVVGFLSFKKVDFNFSAEGNENCAMCGVSGNFKVEDLPVGPRWFCTEKHFAEYTGLPVKESGYYGFEAESITENPQGRPHCMPCAERGFNYYADKTCGDCGIIMCERCFGSGEICKSCGDVECAKCGDMESPDWVSVTPYGEFCIDCYNVYIEDPSATAESFEAEELVQCKGHLPSCKNMIDPNRTWWIDEKGEGWPALDEYGEEGYCDDCIGYSIDSHSRALGQGHDAESFEAKGIDEKLKDYWYQNVRETWRDYRFEHYQNSKLNRSMKSCVKEWLKHEGQGNDMIPERMVEWFYEVNDEIPTPTDAQQKREIRYLTSVIRKVAREMDENGEWKRYMWNPEVLNDLQMRDIIHGEWDAESFEAIVGTLNNCPECNEPLGGVYLLDNAYGRQDRVQSCKCGWYEVEPSYGAESKKLPPVEKAIDTGIASGATMEGLETLLAAESEIDEKDAQTIAKQAWNNIMKHISENPYLIYDEREHTGCGHGGGGKSEHWWMDEAIDYFRNKISTPDGYFLLENLIEQKFQDKAQNDQWMKGILRSTLTQMKKQADKMDEDDEWEAFINDVRARADEESWRQTWAADYPTTKPNCKCGATLEWDNLRKAWYCISCPFNTYKAEENLCDCGEKTEITCEICSKEHGDLCKICYDEHIVDCPHCEGDGGIPRSWVSDSGDRWNPPSLDITSFDTCEYCEGEGKICESDYDNIPQFSWDAESFSAEKGTRKCLACGNFSPQAVMEFVGFFGYHKNARTKGRINPKFMCKPCRKERGGLPTELPMGRRQRLSERLDISALPSKRGSGKMKHCVVCKAKEFVDELNVLGECRVCVKTDWLKRTALSQTILENGYQCPDCDDGMVYEEIHGEEDEDYFLDGSDTTWKYSTIQTCDVCDYVKKEVISTFCENCGEELFSTGEKGKYEKCTCAFGDDFFDVATPFDDSASFSAESDELEESKKRTKMSAIRTGLAITTFSIVMWNLWTNKKQEKDIADIMDLV